MQTITATKDQLAAAFQTWNDVYLENPGKFQEDLTKDDTAANQAQNLINLLNGKPIGE